MNKYLDIIPTPKQLEYTKGSPLKISTVCVIGMIPRVLNHALGMLNGDCPYVDVKKEEADLIIYHGLENVPEGVLSEKDLATFDNLFAPEQGYVLKKEKDSPMIIAGKSEKGTVYGIMTLLQILGKEVEEILIYDWPDFLGRGVKWLIWAELGIWSYDFGDGIEAYKERIGRKYDQLLRYKITGVNNSNYGFATDQFPGYNELMECLREEARDRGFGISCTGYSMGYGMLGYDGTYQGEGFMNRKSYPDGEVYECIGTYDPYKFVTDKEVDRSVRLTEVRAREYGTCLSNDELTDLKVANVHKIMKLIHPTGIGFHNMDSHEIHPEMWVCRCVRCREKWPNDDLYAKDGMAGAFAHYIDRLIDGITSFKDGDYDASEGVSVHMASPGYCYAEASLDEDYDNGIKFWTSVHKYMRNSKKFSTGIREQYFYHNKPVRRCETIAEYVRKGEFKCGMGFFVGGDGFYDDKLISLTSALMFIAKGVSATSIQSGNAFQEPQQLLNAEYMWNTEASGFYNLEPKPQNQEEYLKTFDDFLMSRVSPEGIYGKDGFIDVACNKLYGEKVGQKMAKLFKLRGKNGEQPVPCASSVDLYTDYRKNIFPMRWDIEDITDEKIAHFKERYEQCFIVTKEARDIMKEVVAEFDGDEKRKDDLVWFAECFDFCTDLIELFKDYMNIYSELHPSLGEGRQVRADLEGEILVLRGKIEKYNAKVKASPRKAIDTLGGSIVRRGMMGEYLDYWTSIMLSSIKTGKRIPDDVRELPKKEWW